MVNDENVDAIISEIAGLGDDQISPTLYDTYSENLRNAVDQVFKRDSNSGMSDQLRANVARFAAYKAMNITKEVRGELGNDLDKAAHILRTANRTQATEYNTTISRCRTAKQFAKFNAGDNARLFPNLRWLPSRSADPREAHMLFYDKVWAKDDGFWDKNTPGSLWNCKCDWEETDDPVTDGNPKGSLSAKGLCGNPGNTGEVFTTLNSELSKKGKENGYKAHPYFTSVDIVEGEQMVSRLYYQDNQSELMISAMADPSEISDNIATGRVLSKYCTVKVAPHFTQSSGFSKKNPEFIIDGTIADAKRINSEKGISTGFKAALGQGCKIVIFDYDKNKTPLNENSTASHIANRSADFKTGKIEVCYVVKNGNVAKIDASVFQGNKDRYTLIGDISSLIKKAMK